MKKIRSYDDPLNFDITNRPSNSTLIIAVWFGFFLSIFPGGVLLPLIYVWLVGEPEGGWALFWAAIGAIIGMAIYFPLNNDRGRAKKREFVSCGGDPTGITDFMFGGMGGNRNAKGVWQWTFPSSDI